MVVHAKQRQQNNHVLYRYREQSNHVLLLQIERRRRRAHRVTATTTTKQASGELKFYCNMMRGCTNGVYQWKENMHKHMYNTDTDTQTSIHTHSLSHSASTFCDTFFHSLSAVGTDIHFSKLVDCTTFPLTITAHISVMCISLSFSLSLPTLVYHESYRMCFCVATIYKIQYCITPKKMHRKLGFGQRIAIANRFQPTRSIGCRVYTVNRHHRNGMK